VSQQTLEFVRDEGSLQSQRRPQQEETPDQRRSPELFDYFTAEDRRTEARRPCYKGNEENWHGCSETTPMPTNSSRSIEGMSSFKESAYQTSTIDRSVSPEEVLVPEEVERILNKTTPRARKKTSTKERPKTPSPASAQRKKRPERRLLNYEETSGTSSTEEDEEERPPQSAKKKASKKIRTKRVKKKIQEEVNTGTSSEEEEIEPS